MAACFVLLALLVCLCTGSASAQVPPSATDGARVTDIQFRGLRRVSRDEVANTVRLRVGDVLSARAVNEDIHRLNELGYFDPLGIDVRQEPHADGLRVVFNLVELPLVSRVDFAGNRAFDDKKLRSTIGIFEGTPLDTPLHKISTSRLEDLYRENGYQFAEITRQDKLDKTANTALIEFVINEGPRTRLDKIVFKGNKTFSARKLRSLMTTKPRQLFWGGVFDRRTFDMDLLNITRFYKDEGFLDAVVSGNMEYSWDKCKLTIVVDVIESVRYRVTDVTIRGAERFTGEALHALLGMTKDSAFTLKQYDADHRALQNFYGQRGYLSAVIARKELFPEPGRIELVYNVTEREPVTLGRIDVRGNYKTQDKVIRRQFTLFPGEVLDVTQLRGSLGRLRQLRYFTKVESSFAEGDEPDTRNVVVEVEEGPTGQIVFGAGVSSNAGLIGEIMLNLSNFDITDFPTSFDDFFSGNSFVGGGQTFILQLRPGTESTQARVFFSEPYLFDSPFSFSSDIFYYERDREHYDEKRTGVRLGLGHRFTDALQLRLTGRFEQVDIQSVSWNAPAQVMAMEDTTSDVHSLILSGDYNKTDSVWFPTKGYRLIGSVEVADDALGSDFNFLKVIGEARYYRTMYTDRNNFKHVLTMRGKAGVADRTHGPDIPFFEKFYAGGRNSVRGFEFRGLGPHDGDDPIGGEWMAILNVEYSFPLIGNTVRGVFFADAGTVGEDLDDLSAPIRGGVGFGLHIRPAQMNIPIVLDWAVPINVQDDDATQVFSFTIGTMF